MGIAVSVTLASLFLFLCGFNLWNMLRGTSTRNAKLWVHVHRACGYAFIAVFIIFVYFMLLRIKGPSDELPPRLILHVAMAFALAPLLLIKVMVARYQKAARGLLTALGVAIFVIAVTLVSLNLAIHFLSLASPQKVGYRTSAAVVVAVLLSLATAFYFPGRRPKPSAGENPVTVSGGKASRRSSEVFTLTLARIETQTHDAKTLRFALARGRQVAARPGQFMTFQFVIDGKSVTRSYSICSPPTRQGYIEITAKRMENGCVSRFLNESAQPGLTVQARGPYGRFYLDDNQHERIVLLAAGSGITPMMAMLRYLDDRCLALPATLIYCVRTEGDVFFKSELEELQVRQSKFGYVPVVSQPGPEWGGWQGRLRREILEREVEKPLESTFFLCGPPGFMESSRALLMEMSVQSSQILQESFGGAPVSDKARTRGHGVKIKLERCGVICSPSEDESLLESLERNAVSLPSGCRQGSCGTCATRLLSGNVRMEREDGLDNEMRSAGYILPCVSRALTDVTLDA